MSINERIHFFRQNRNLTMKQLGKMIGFSEKYANDRIGQYEIGYRTPKPPTIEKLSNALLVSQEALSVSRLDTVDQVMQALFFLEDNYGLTFVQKDNVLLLTVDPKQGDQAEALTRQIKRWGRRFWKLSDGNLSRTEYDFWRYNLKEQKEPS